MHFSLDNENFGWVTMKKPEETNTGVTPRSFFSLVLRFLAAGNINNMRPFSFFRSLLREHLVRAKLERRLQGGISSFASVSERGPTCHCISSDVV